MEKDSRYLQNIGYVLKSKAVKQLGFMVAMAASVTAGIYVYMSIQQSDFRPLDYHVTEKNMSKIIDALEKSHIKYKLDDANGMIYVSNGDYVNAKMKLSSSGIAKDDSINFSYLNESSSLGESQFIESARYLRALEGDLAKTISAIDGISYARVHIATPKNNTFVDEGTKTTASVFIAVASGLLSDKEKIRSIIQLVASSVPGLDPKDVSITDQYGHYLSDSLTEGALISAEQMNYQNNLQNYFEKRIESLIVPIVGENRINVRVHTDIDFSQEEQAKEEYDPSQKVVRSEQSTTEEMGSSAAQGAAGALANSPPSDQEGSSNAKGQTNSSQGRTQTIKNYELGKSVTYKKSNYAKVNNISVAVIVDNEMITDPKTKKSTPKPLDQEKLNKITELVKATIGFDEKRGDKVTVVNSAFTLPNNIQEPEKTAFWEKPWFTPLLKNIASVIFGLIILLILYRRISAYLIANKVTGKEAQAVAEEYDGITQEMRDLKQEQIMRLKELSSKDPDRVSLVIKNWVAK